ncbi:hypothetical protein ACU686_10435 [Yinghuangia aomiensis]
MLGTGGAGEPDPRQPRAGDAPAVQLVERPDLPGRVVDEQAAPAVFDAEA